ncbi:D-alanyl-D-alanine carboxypeptidase family protein [Agarilytica rhodophyticola]|uniref:D-alanyl-D-alanine carboxypeptidase family protein n=1 Tax=Agarilytica rhodophyticola TaxID=1737490 RepID=UPI000B345363|nr:D-alanyl-D-alanine carboxypeptidase family protein [Agarilytica rhodophyticola]
MSFFKLRSIFSLMVVSLAANAVVATAAPVIIPAPPKLSASAYLLIDADTGKVIVESNSTTPLPPASLTKMMTSYIVSDEIHEGRLKETDLVTISEDAWRRGGTKSGSSTMFLNPRSQVKVIDLLRGVIIQSGNDASIALAQHISGSEESFADVMNQQAQLLGMKSTQFKNATGWPADGHVSTAYDLAILAKALINDHPDHYSIYSEKYFKYNGINQPNRNKLLFTDKFVDGLKTGHTNEAGFGLVASSLKDNMRLISVVLGTRSEKQRASESQRLLAYGFRYYKTHALYKATDVLNTSRVWGGLADEVKLGVKKDLVATIPRGSHKNLEAQTQVDNTIKAPITKGQVLGKLLVTLEGETIIEQELVAVEAVEEAGFISRMWDNVLLMIGGE